MRQRGSGSIRRRFFERVTERGARNSRSIVAALIASIFARIVSSSFRCPLRSKAGSKIGNKCRISSDWSHLISSEWDHPISG
jgi:hypothetical protein